MLHDFIILSFIIIFKAKWLNMNFKLTVAYTYIRFIYHWKVTL